MPKFEIIFTMPMACSCVVDAKDGNEAARLVSNVKWRQLEDLGFQPTVDDSNPEGDDRAEICSVRKCND